MKFATAAAVTAYGMTLLASSASAADARKTSKLRADDALFHHRRAEEDAMSMPTDTAKNSWPWEPSYGCVPSPTKCLGRQYYRVLTGPELTPPNNDAQVAWIEFYDNVSRQSSSLSYDHIICTKVLFVHINSHILILYY